MDLSASLSHSSSPYLLLHLSLSLKHTHTHTHTHTQTHKNCGDELIRVDGGFVAHWSIDQVKKCMFGPFGSIAELSFRAPSSHIYTLRAKRNCPLPPHTSPFASSPPLLPPSMNSPSTRFPDPSTVFTPNVHLA